jgi:hypothetical protein
VLSTLKFLRERLGRCDSWNTWIRVHAMLGTLIRVVLGFSRLNVGVILG